MLTKIQQSIVKYGLLKTIVKIILYPFNKIYLLHFKKSVLGLENIEDRFTQIYEKNHWGDKESVSGVGSTVEYTKNIRSELPKIFQKFNIKKIFDAPCGDFNWMKLVINETNVKYVGGDIVLPLVNRNNNSYASNNIEFIHIDLTKDFFPSADLMICRDCLFHLSYEDIFLFLNNFVNSDIKFLLTTTHMRNNFKNNNIESGDFRLIDLLSSPFYFPPDVLYQFDDWNSPEPRRQMCLWTKTQIVEALKTHSLS